MAIERLVDALAVCGLTGPSWAPWRTLAKCIDGAPLDRDEQALYEQCTGRTRALTEPPSETWIIVGRRGGKSRVGGAAAVRAAARRYPLAPGEQAVVGLAAADREQARVLLGYATAPFRAADELRPLVASRSSWAALRSLVSRETRWSIDLKTETTIEVRAAHFGRIRGRTYALAVADEAAFWQAEDGSNPASEVLAAIRPGLATLHGQLLVITTPFSKSGPVFDAYRRYWGVDDPRVLVWQAGTRVMNPLIPQALVEEALARDPEAAKAEWLGLFRDDLSALVTDAALRACVDAGRGLLEPSPGLTYLCFVDPATGSGQDSMTMALAHREPTTGVAVVDGVGEARPPFDPSAVVMQIAGMVRAYRVPCVYGDGFAKGWTGALFEQAALPYRVSPLTKSEIYLTGLAAINSRRIRLPDEPRLLAQIAGLVRKPTAAGRESVDHAARAGAHDDVANAALGAAALVERGAGSPARLW